MSGMAEENTHQVNQFRFYFMRSTPKEQKHLPTVFIVSSIEALPIAQAVKSNFDHEANVDIWSENIFSINRNFLETLLNRASYYDFCIAIFSGDDEAKIRGKKEKITRDNVILEFGLFLGRLGPDRTFFILEENVRLFSDWNGIAKATFRKRDPLEAAVGNACNQLRQEMAKADRLQHFTMLPSTSLAIGYYNNFLKKIFDALSTNTEFTVVERDKQGKVIFQEQFDIANTKPTIHVRLPRKLSDLEPELLKHKTVKYRQITIPTPFRPFPFFITGAIGKNPRTISFFDIPTTMLSSKIAIDHIFTRQFLAGNNVRQHLEDREIANFERTLRILVPDVIEKRFFKFSVME